MKKPTAKLELSKQEVDSVVWYIHQHVRASETGLGYKTWKKMYEWLQRENGLYSEWKADREQKRQENAPLPLDFE